jgi:hypothetical protein
MQTMETGCGIVFQWVKRAVFCGKLKWAIRGTKGTRTVMEPGTRENENAPHLYTKTDG